MRKQLAIRASATLLSLFIAQTPSVSSPSRFRVQNEKPYLINEVCTSRDQLTYDGYEVSRNYDEDVQESRVVIKKAGKVLTIHSDGRGIAEKETSCFGLYPVLGGKTKQLVVVQTTGGAHCCFRYRIYNLRPTFQLLFDSEKYPIGGGFDKLEFNDIDGDGVHEFTQRDITFHYWEDMAYVSSPEPEVVFQYNPRAKRFLPGNKKFKAYLLKDIEKDIENQDPNVPKHWSWSLEITLRYIFAGNEKAGWRFYDKQFGIKPGARDKAKTKIKNELKRDVLYRSIYGR